MNDNRIQTVSPVALVTGSARRIGAAIVRQLHQAGYRVVIHALQHRLEAEALAQALNQERADSARVCCADLRDPQAIASLAQTAIAWQGRLDLLVNNASVFWRDEAAGLDSQAWSMQFEINLRAPQLLSLACQTSLTAAQGAIVNIADIHGDRPLKGYSVYCQTKAGLIMQTRALAKEFSPSVRVNAVSPGAIAWPEAANALSKAQQEKIISQTLLKAHGRPEYIAEAVLALAGNRYITGQVLAVDGGRSV